ncbi:hypothetical protein FN846DRAFT_600909 [Sphaerosporella brunnea]|uniref:Fe2OG dioxygenase domain-containing protein n=1 Tax=Sphaerosporella brunnea TaxID=1250544 RepID=A0A5J5F238_9PEZI|nr:hypothetical protein FN846DRAFT_600909 [Sphaerosporella brunnea]
MPPSTALPIIDLSPFLSPSSTPEQKRAAAAALNDACTTHGFFYLTAHGVPAELESRVLALARKFFLDTPAATKAAIQRLDPGAAGGDGARGYQRLGENVTQGASDHHEAIDFYRPVEAEEAVGGKGYGLLRGPNLWPDQPEGFRAAFEEYWKRLTQLGDAVMKAMAWALGYEGDEDVILRWTDQPFWVARVIGYPPLKGEGVSCGVHTDYGCTTFLLADDTPGSLQVLSKDGEWLDADMIKGCYVVNIGDMVSVMTNGLWQSTKHRVIHTGDRYRVSVPFFYEPNWDAVIKPLEKCVQKTGGAEKYGEVVYSAHLMGKVSGNFYSAATDGK